jgi:hypothetical protein
LIEEYVKGIESVADGYKIRLTDFAEKGED